MTVLIPFSSQYVLCKESHVGGFFNLFSLWEYFNEDLKSFMIIFKHFRSFGI